MAGKRSVRVRHSFRLGGFQWACAFLASLAMSFICAATSPSALAAEEGTIIRLSFPQGRRPIPIMQLDSAEFAIPSSHLENGKRVWSLWWTDDGASQRQIIRVGEHILTRKGVLRIVDCNESDDGAGVDLIREPDKIVLPPGVECIVPPNSRGFASLYGRATYFHSLDRKRQPARIQIRVGAEPTHTLYEATDGELCFVGVQQYRAHVLTTKFGDWLLLSNPTGKEPKRTNGPLR